MADNTEKKNRGTLINILDLEDSECAQGISFDPEVEYTFTVTSREAHELKSEKDGHEKKFTIIELQCTEQESEATIRMSFFHNKKVIINEDDHTKESDAIKFARAMGHKVGVGLPFKWGEIFKEGIQFKAHTKLQMKPDGKTPSGYSEVNLDTIVPVKGGAKASQAKISGSKDDETYLIVEATKYPNKEKLIPAIATARPDLVNLLMQMDAQGKLSYKA